MEAPETWGVKYKCPFNVFEALHCVEALPPDLLQDQLAEVQDLWVPHLRSQFFVNVKKM